ncbi:MAG TPA: M28 family metallopeptidase, partial [bacterium]|nr:M28 family metallopeptidase [bacterium]
LKAINYLKNYAEKLNYEVIEIPFDCQIWKSKKSIIKINDKKIEIFASPFSPYFKAEKKIAVVNNFEELSNTDLTDKIVCLQNEITQEPLMPKNFPFYYPDEHKNIIETLERKRPAAILTVTKKHQMCGLTPFPLFEDGNFLIPSAYIDTAAAKTLFSQSPQKIFLHINSFSKKSESSQIIITKKSESNNKDNKKIIVICAHIDSKYNTPGAIDNASGIAVLLELMATLKDINFKYEIQFIPFNGEEYYEVSGELKYLEFMNDCLQNIEMVVNLDGLGYNKFKTSVSLYNFEMLEKNKISQIINRFENINLGEEWYAGDHSIFAFQKIKAAAFTASDTNSEVLNITHTQKDTIDNIDIESLIATAEFVKELLLTVL